MLHLKRGFRPLAKGLSEEQRLMYGSEKLMNFRWISRMCATKSPRALTADDMVDWDLHLELGSLGQFAEVAYGIIDPEYVFSHLESLTSPTFPLEGYDALPGTQLIRALHGSVADLQGYVAYRKEKAQIIVAFSGTRSAMQAYNDVLFMKRAYPPNPSCEVHHGFWSLYQGIAGQTIASIRTALELHNDVKEIVIMGHSMGGAMSYLLALDLLQDSSTIRINGINIKLVVFGCPRVGDPALVEYWHELVGAYRESHGEAAVTEYSVKAYNDGVPAIPPLVFGYRHFCRNPLYLVHDRFYRIPESEFEHGLFDVVENKDGSGEHPAPLFPRGGHNYYGRDMEKFTRRMEWVSKMMAGGDDWEERYKKRIAKHERKLKKSKST